MSIAAFRRPALLAAFLTAALALDASAQQESPDTAAVALATRLLAASHATEQSLAGMEVMIAAQRTLSPKIPAVFWDRFLVRLREDAGEFTQMLAVVYASHFTPAELQGLLDFYATPLGQHLVAVQPALMQESVAGGQRLGAKIGMTVGEELAAEGIVFTP